MTTLSALTAVPGTVLATAALTSQEALAAVTDQAILNDPTEGINFGGIVSVMAVQMQTKIAIRRGYESHGLIGKNILDKARELMVTSGVQSPKGSIQRLVESLRSDLLRIGSDIYNRIAQNALDFGLAVFGHTVPAISADPVQAGVAAVVEDHWSDESLLRKMKEEFVASRLLSVAIEGRSDAGAGVLSLLIVRAGEGNSAAIEALCKYANAARDGTSSRNFTKDHLAQLEDIIKGSGLERRLVEILLSVRKAIMRVRVDLLPET